MKIIRAYEDEDTLCITAKNEKWGWRDASVGNNTHCFSKGPVLNSQHLHGASQLPTAPLPGDLTPSSSLCGHQAHTDMHSGKNTHTIK